MSTELNLEAEGAARVEGLLDALDAMQRDPALCKYHGVLRHAELTIAARRAAPSAPMVEELPALPTEAQLRHALKEIPLCYPWGTGRKLVREGTSLDWVSQRESTGSNTQLADMNKNFVNSTIAATVAVMTSYIAPYAERIRVLERANSSNSSSSCAQQQAQSIDSPEFRKLFFAAKHAPWNFDGSTPELAALIAYIDGRAAGAAPELYTCIGKGGTYELVGEADGAGYVRGGTVTVYRDATSGNLYYRTPVDFKTRMERIAAAPSPQPGKEGGNGQG